MLLKEYLNAARRHLHTCDYILSAIKIRHMHRNDLIKNLYYLSGYIIECSVKYGIITLNGHDRNRDVEDFNSNGIIYARDLKHHEFKKFELLIKRFSIQAPLISTQIHVEPEVKKLYESWRSTIRYDCSINCNHDCYIKFFECSKLIFTEIEKRAIA